ncbi:hypothetical protein FA09DRAFT_329728 [Tilletiopsis washingtonensis]|uniref:DAGKc domain-containing protein n=1 Tax=Tilletiopsis washingtonensis TaxID=58919 RepID=A0A316ZAP3_9BASI|nr:hypothetical protein FA09DRAFT_329728 [Tilletiopsis washingtonensis]PWN98094.1 hypothetical protein FA09DRAFT_329728 [Tilletiopsis washingtonensis]
MSSCPQQVHLIVNAAAGAPGVSKRLEAVVLARLRSAGIAVQRHSTQSAGDGARIGRELRSTGQQAGSSSSSDDAGLVAVLLGGDGTTGEVLNGLYDAEGRGLAVRLALIPTGTANALYAGLYPEAAAAAAVAENSEDDAWRLHSLDALLSQSGQLVPLTLSRVRPSHGDAQKTALAHLVVSHALHAAILHDAEALRASHPGVERFKIAARQNSTVWHAGTLTLHGNARVYDPATQAFKALSGEDSTLDGPVIYLTAMSTDRLEPTFVPAPFGSLVGAEPPSPLARPPGDLDVLLIRPLRSPCVQRKLAGRAWHGTAAEDVRAAFAQEVLWPLTGKMYEKGAHVDMRYAESGGEEPGRIGSDGAGPLVFEYYRAQGYDWVAHASADTRSLVCVDGAVSGAERTEVRTLGSAEGSSVHVYR